MEQKRKLKFDDEQVRASFGYVQFLLSGHFCGMSKVKGMGLVFCGGGGVGWIRYMRLVAVGHKLSPVEAQSNRTEHPPGLVVCGKWRLLAESYGWISAKISSPLVL